MKIVTFPVALILAAVVPGCTKNDAVPSATNEEPRGGPHEGHASTDSRSFTPGILPDVGGGSCESAKSSLTSCEWAGSSDAIVVGEIAEVAAFESPAWGPDLLTPGSSPEACVVIQHGLRLRVTVIDWLKGETPEDLTVYVGGQTLSGWMQRPKLENATTVWSNLPAGADAPLAVGMTVGLPIAYIEELKAWTLFGASAFAFTDAGAPVFGAGECTPRGPTDLGMTPTYDSFVTTVQACAGESATTFGTNTLAWRHDQGKSADLSTTAYCALPATE